MQGERLEEKREKRESGVRGGGGGGGWGGERGKRGKGKERWEMMGEGMNEERTHNGTDKNEMRIQESKRKLH